MSLLQTGWIITGLDNNCTKMNKKAFKYKALNIKLANSNVNAILFLDSFVWAVTIVADLKLDYAQG